ncbi:MULTISPECIES: aldolase/citrate lyase family protein [unclassified Mesorhizobium]|uniref:HpcH/HpaI aldolase family protein n=1 Tax=unclassified Mesorhizobium TaxID=325217 RepID=UPI001126B73B|nr:MULTISPECIES: aldolase/citrate lyase family protein [unclassified Mesorhizobium]TPJ30177.1 4-hydroxy-2-oxovalerate aldolase [Mesorhizobium sp. B2-7-2]TPJ79166.1 4-hydroxy-2-oxovalerate aldolase [Mesorhizobium sp. B2-6-2]
MFKPNELKRRLAAGEQLLGAWIATGSATVVEIMGNAGFDFLLIDLEHGQGELNDLVHMLRAAENTGTRCIVRVPWNDPVTLKRVLDAGVDSVMVPMVETEAEAAAAVRACHYPPHGSRGYAAPLVRASNYGLVKDYIHIANENLLLIVQIESASAAAKAGEIAVVEGIDMVFVGVNDLAGSIGRLEQLDQRDVRDLVAQAESQVRASNRWLGTVPSAGATWDELLAAGYNLLPITSDVTLLRDAAADLVRVQRGKRTGDLSEPARSKAQSGY